ATVRARRPGGGRALLRDQDRAPVAGDPRPDAAAPLLAAPPGRADRPPLERPARQAGRAVAARPDPPGRRGRGGPGLSDRRLRRPPAVGADRDRRRPRRPWPARHVRRARQPRLRRPRPRRRAAGAVLAVRRRSGRLPHGGAGHHGAAQRGGPPVRQRNAALDRRRGRPAHIPRRPLAGVRRRAARRAVDLPRPLVGADAGRGRARRTAGAGRPLARRPGTAAVPATAVPQLLPRAAEGRRPLAGGQHRAARQPGAGRHRPPALPRPPPGSPADAEESLENVGPVRSSRGRTTWDRDRRAVLGGSGRPPRTRRPRFRPPLGTTNRPASANIETTFYVPRHRGPRSPRPSSLGREGTIIARLMASWIKARVRLPRIRGGLHAAGKAMLGAVPRRDRGGVAS